MSSVKDASVNLADIDKDDSGFDRSPNKTQANFQIHNLRTQKLSQMEQIKKEMRNFELMDDDDQIEIIHGGESEFDQKEESKLDKFKSGVKNELSALKKSMNEFKESSQQSMRREMNES